MSRKSLEIDKSLVEKIATDLEAKGPLPNRSKLYEAIVVELVKNHGYKPFSATVIYQRNKEWKIEFKTPVGVRGQHLAGGNIEAIKKWRESGGESNQRKVGDSTQLIKHWTKEEKGKYLKLAKSIKRGSLKAAVKLKCLECANYDKKEIADCLCKDCPLFPVRPFQTLQIGIKRDEHSLEIL
jgi:hypothetical protein